MTHVIMNVDRPNGSGGTYKAGVEYDLADDLAALWRGMGICRLTTVRSEQTGAVVSATTGNFPDAPAMNKRIPVEAIPSVGKAATATAGDLILQSAAPVLTTIKWGDSLMMNTNAPFSPSAVSYDNATGVLTVTYASHGFATGQELFLGVKKSPAWGHWNLPATRIDANSFTLPCRPGLGVAPVASDVRIGNHWILISESPYAWLDPRRPKLVRNCGVTDDWAQHIWARRADVAAVDSRVVEIRMGTNDLVQATPTPVSDVFALLRQAVEFVLNLGRVAIVHTIPPLGAPTAAQAQWTEAYRRLVLTLPAIYPGVLICDDYAATVDPASATGAAAAGMLMGDNIHFAPKGARAIKPRLQACYDRVMQTVSPLPVSRMQAYDATNNPSGFDAVANGLLATATGGTVTAPVTGTAASGATVSIVGMGGAATASVVAAANGVGNAQRVVGNSAANGDLMMVAFSSLQSRIAAGEKRRFQAHIKTSGVATNGKVKNITVMLRLDIDGVTYQRTYSCYSYSSSDALFAQTDVDADFETEEITLPAGSYTSVSARVIIEFAGAGGGNVTFDVSQPAFPLVP